MVTVKYDIKDFLGRGWHGIDTDGFHKWAWSKKEAFLNFPANHKGFSLYLSGGEQEKEAFFYDTKRGLIGKYVLGPSLKQFDILPLTNSVKIEVSDLSIGRNRDIRKIGIALRDATSLNAYREVSNIPPFNFGIEITTLCNMNPSCVMCDKSIPDMVIQMSSIPDHIVDKLKPFFKCAHIVSLTGSGEPLLCKNLFKILDSIDSTKIFTMFNSNGLLLTKEKSEKLISRRLGAIDFSIDAARAGTYGKIRNRGKFSMLKNNIKELSTLKKRNNINYPKIIINMVLMRENVNETPSFIELAAEVGAQAVYIKLLKPVDKNFTVKKEGFYFDYKKQMIDPDDQKFKDNVLLAKERAAGLGIEFKGADSAIQKLLESDNNLHAIDSPYGTEPVCKKPWTEALIGINGSVKFCCHLQPKDKKHNIVLGNLNEQSFEDIWDGAMVKRFRNKFINKVFPLECWSCPYYDINKY